MTTTAPEPTASKATRLALALRTHASRLLAKAGLSSQAGAQDMLDAAEILEEEAIMSDPELVAASRAACGRLAIGNLTPENEAWLPMRWAPRDATIVRLLVKFEENSLDDTPEPVQTIGHNNFDHDSQDVWQFAGWNWQQDHYTEGMGTPIGWLPFASKSPVAPAAAYAPLQTDEVKDLTAMVWGAPYGDEAIVGVALPIIRQYEALLTTGERPLDPVDGQTRAGQVDIDSIEQSFKLELATQGGDATNTASDAPSASSTTGQEES